LIAQGGVRLDGERLTDTKHQLKAGAVYVFQIGKRQFTEITVKQKS
jgi:tyrosyl-tRNA synthetase